MVEIADDGANDWMETKYGYKVDREAVDRSKLRVERPTKDGNRSTPILYAALRLSPADSIGVPVFLGGNAMYVPEMDADFNISGFVHFVNEDQYAVTFDIPDRYCDHFFAVGDPSPIIFWINDASHIVEGDAEKTKLAEIFGPLARSHQVLVDYLYEGWPHVPFKYNQPDFINMMKKRLIKGRDRKSWKTAHLLSRLLFGDREAPPEIDEIALLYMQAELKVFRSALTVAEAQHRDDEGLYGGVEMAELARTVVNKFEQVNDLSCVMHGDDRKRGVIMSGRFQVWPEEIEEYKTYLAKVQRDEASR